MDQNSNASKNGTYGNAFDSIFHASFIPIVIVTCVFLAGLLKPKLNFLRKTLLSTLLVLRVINALIKGNINVANLLKIHHLTLNCLDGVCCMSKRLACNAFQRQTVAFFNTFSKGH